MWNKRPRRHIPRFKTMLLSTVSLSGCIWFFFPPLIKAKLHKIGHLQWGQLQTRSFSFWLSVHVSFIRPECECQVYAGDRLIHFPLCSPFLSISTSLCVSLAPSDQPHTRCQREIATSVCPVRCVMYDNLWRARHVPAVSGFHEKLLIVINLGIIIISWSRRDGSLCGVVPKNP